MTQDIERLHRQIRRQIEDLVGGALRACENKLFWRHEENLEKVCEEVAYILTDLSAAKTLHECLWAWGELDDAVLTDLTIAVDKAQDVVAQFGYMMSHDGFDRRDLLALVGEVDAAVHFVYKRFHP